MSPDTAVLLIRRSLVRAQVERDIHEGSGENVRSFPFARRIDMRRLDFEFVEIYFGLALTPDESQPSRLVVNLNVPVGLSFESRDVHPV